MKLKILGSVSPYVKDKENCPGYLIKKNNTNLLLDCGSGVTREMRLPYDLNNLTIIISHLHRDHYADLLILGYATFVYHKLGMLNEKVKVYIPDEESLDNTYLKNMEEHYFDFISYNEKSKLKIDNLEVSFNKNPHPVLTYSIKVNDDEHTVVYSSDTGYKNNSLENFANNADLLICETTFLTTQKGKEDNHLTTKEAGKIANKAKVKKLLITHTWPELDKKLYLKETRKIFKKTIAPSTGKVLKIGR